MEKVGASAMSVLVLSSLMILIMLSGCTSGSQAPQQGAGTRNFSGNTSRFGQNMTDAQRQQMMQSLTAACQNKAEGDSCTVQTPRGNMTGTCKTQNQTLVCLAGGGGMRGNRSTGN